MKEPFGTGRGSGPRAASRVFPEHPLYACLGQDPVSSSESDRVVGETSQYAGKQVILDQEKKLANV